MDGNSQRKLGGDGAMTLLRTHHAVNIGLTAILVGAIMNHPLLSVTIAQTATILTDRIIDLAGHSPSRVHPGIMKRTPLTHSIITAPAWAVAIGIAGTYATDLLFRPATTFYHIPLITLPPDMATPIVLSCLLAAFVHLLLDSTTQAGIYVPHLPCREDTRIFRRWKLAGFRHDNLPLNISLTLLGLAAYASYLIYGNAHLLNALTTFTKTPPPLELSCSRHSIGGGDTAAVAAFTIAAILAVAAYIATPTLGLLALKRYKANRAKTKALNFDDRASEPAFKS